MAKQEPRTSTEQAFIAPEWGLRSLNAEDGLGQSQVTRKYSPGKRCEDARTIDRSTVSVSKSVYTAVMSNKSKSCFTSKLVNPLARQQFQEIREEVMSRMTRGERLRERIQKGARNRLAAVDIVVDEEDQFQDLGNKVYFESDP